MVRQLTGMVIGVGLALIIFMISEAIGHRLFPLAEEGVTEFSLPAQSLLPVVIGWALGTFAGGYTAIRIGRTDWQAWAVAAAIIVSVFIGYALAVEGTFPAWMLIAGTALPIAAAWLARRLAVSE